MKRLYLKLFGQFGPVESHRIESDCTWRIFGSLKGS
jgi:hypothetical protein